MNIGKAERNRKFVRIVNYEFAELFVDNYSIIS
jgi:hypothetical protein